MGPTLLIDKSTLQLLSLKEVYELDGYYYPDLTSVLVAEVLGDLSKTRKGWSGSKEVSTLAAKLAALHRCTHEEYEVLAVHSLMGSDIPMSRQIIPSRGEAFVTSDGRGMIIDAEERSNQLFRWEAGKFTVQEKMLAKIWRKVTRALDMGTFRRLLDEHLIIVPTATSFTELKDAVDRLFRNPHLQRVFLQLLLADLGISSEWTMKIAQRWNAQQPFYLDDFAPYAGYCARVYFTFLAGLSCGLINQEPTNRIDLTYLYYIPFHEGFSSNDKLHRNLAPILLGEDQFFIKGEDLKNDMQMLRKAREEANDQNQFPPACRNENCRTYMIWKELRYVI